MHYIQTWFNLHRRIKELEAECNSANELLMSEQQLTNSMRKEISRLNTELKELKAQFPPQVTNRIEVVVPELADLLSELKGTKKP